MEPERDIEKTLEAYAQKRREEAGAPLELHPATRNVLQGEVARSTPRKAARPGFWSFLRGPSVAVACIFVLLAGVFGALQMFTNTNKPANLALGNAPASKDSFSDRETLAQKEPAPAVDRERKPAGEM